MLICECELFLSALSKREREIMKKRGEINRKHRSMRLHCMMAFGNRLTWLFICCLLPELNIHIIHGRRSILISSCTNSILHAQQAGRSVAESSISISTVQPSCVVCAVLDGCCRSSTCGDASLGPLSHRASFDSLVTDDGVLRVCVLRVSCAYHVLLSEYP